MPEVFPFRAVHYREMSRLKSLIAPPYDVISPAQQQALYDESPFNIVRLELGKSGRNKDPESRYREAAARLRQWVVDEVLVQDQDPFFYVYRQTYQLPDHAPRTRTAVFAEVGLEDFSTGKIRPHEETFSGPKEDRLKLLRATRANISPVFGLYPDTPEAAFILEEEASTAAAADFMDTAGIRHRLWRLRNPDKCEIVTQALADKTILIADGHHRYETALEYRNERRKQTPDLKGAWYERVMFALVSMSDPGLVALPTHRILRGADPRKLQGWRERLHRAIITPVAPDAASARQALRGSLAEDGRRFVFVQPGECWLVVWGAAVGSPVERLDVARLHREGLPAIAGSSDPHELGITYTQDLKEAVNTVQRGEAPAAILLNPTPIEEVDLVAASGARMPEKSTYFYPKLPTGLVLRVDTGEESVKEEGRPH